MIVPTSCQNLVKIGPAVSEISRAQKTLRTDGRTDVRTDVRTYGRTLLTHRKLIVDYPSSQF